MGFDPRSFLVLVSPANTKRKEASASRKTVAFCEIKETKGHKRTLRPSISVNDRCMQEKGK